MPKSNPERLLRVKAKLFWFGLLLIIGTLPAALLLVGFGVLYAIEQQWLLLVLAASFISVILVWLVSRIWLRRIQGQLPDLDNHQPLAHWSQHDDEVWQHQQPLISTIIEAQTTWSELPSASLEIIQNIAAQYHKPSEWAFSLPEALRLTEEVSRRYRQVLIDQVPYIEQAKLSYIHTGIANKNSLKTGFRAYKFTYNLYRAYRTLNPIAALVGEARNLVLNQVGKKLLAETDQQLKTALLEEIARTAIDLYSGRFHADTSAPAVGEPAAAVNEITVSIVGQVSAGKSSLVNALCQQINAEVQRLPSATEARRYNCHITPSIRLTLLDLPGLDGSRERENLASEAIKNSDLVIWVLKANQPARQLDTQLKRDIDHYYRQPEQRNKLAPLQFAVLNQIDLLPNTQMDQALSEQTVIQDAIGYNEALLNMQVIATSLVEQPVNLNSVLAMIELLYEQARNTQLNRQRHQGGKIKTLSVQAKRAATLSKNLFRRLIN